MAASVLYFGPDEWSRVQVLKSAGYEVRECPRLEDLESALKTTPQPDAVVVNGIGGAFAHPAVKIVHTQMALAPVIIFPSQDEPTFENSDDLVVQTLARPEEWLAQLAAMIEHARALREDSMVLQERSATLIKQSKNVRLQSAAFRDTSMRLRKRTAQQRERAAALNRAPQKNRKPENTRENDGSPRETPHRHA